MTKGKKYYSLAVAGTTADIDIYGDITSWPWLESDVSAASLSKQLAELDVDTINVNINSYGGEVAEGLAIYNALRRHKAKVVTRCDGFACSIASVVFMAGDERVMNAASLLMVHNAWTRASGNAAELRKQAEDLDTVTSASKRAYLSRVAIDEEALSDLMDAESWLTPQECVDMGFATAVEDFEEAAEPSQSARRAVFERMSEKPKQAAAPEPPDGPEGPGEEPREPEPGPDGPEPGEEPKQADESRMAANLAAFFMSESSR